MKRSSRPRKTAELSKSLHQQLNMYALAASAAGVGVLALSCPAEARIVYTPAHVKIGLHGIRHYNLDLNHDGITDFTIRLFTSPGSISSARILVVKRPAGNGAVGTLQSVSAMYRGIEVGSKDAFGNGILMVECGFSEAGSGTLGKWANVTNRYLGVKFKIHGETHYGWARLSVRTHARPPYLKATLTGYAYETIANKPIITGKTTGPDVIAVQPASLGHLAVGASAIPAWLSGK